MLGSDIELDCRRRRCKLGNRRANPLHQRAYRGQNESAVNVADRATPAAQAVTAVARIAAVPSILKILCQTTGMGFAAIARVTSDSWTACAVHDDVGFGLLPGDELAIETTLCKGVREAFQPIAFDRASMHPRYRGHPAPKMYGFESYVSVPIILEDGAYFGNLCAIDPRPAEVDNERVLGLFRHFAQLIAFELDSQDRLEVMRQDLIREKANAAARERFIAVLAHDLRNPLGSISSCAELLRARKDDPQQVINLASRVTASVKRITGLVDDLFDFARGRMGEGVEVRFEPIQDLSAVISNAIDELRTAHPTREICASIDISGTVVGDRTRLQQLVSNLVGNALVHGSCEAPVRIEALTRDEALTVVVHNDGEPIPEESLPGIFDAFSRHEDESKRRRGLGLGLYIARQVVQAHRGTLEVESTRDGGTIFTARIPTSMRQIGPSL
jgi:signal transduction histidine kinase